jgi:hypothetical protein
LLFFITIASSISEARTLLKSTKGKIAMSTKPLSVEADPSDVTKEQLIRDFKVVVADAEALLKATAGQGR